MIIKRTFHPDKKLIFNEQLGEKELPLVRFHKVSLSIKVYDAIIKWYPRCFRAVHPRNLPFDNSFVSPTHDK